MEMKASSRLNKNDLFKFLLHHMYFNTSGIIYTVVAVLALAGGIYYLISGNITGIFLILICAVYFVLMPFMLYLKAVKQSKTSIFKAAIEYEFRENALYAQAEGTKGDMSHVNWDQIRKVVYFQGEYIIYVSSIRANVIPVTAFDVPKEKVDAFFVSVLPKSKLKGIK